MLCPLAAYRQQSKIGTQPSDSPFSAFDDRRENSQNLESRLFRDACTELYRQPGVILRNIPCTFEEDTLSMPQRRVNNRRLKPQDTWKGACQEKYVTFDKQLRGQVAITDHFGRFWQ